MPPPPIFIINPSLNVSGALRLGKELDDEGAEVTASVEADHAEAAGPTGFAKLRGEPVM